MFYYSKKPRHSGWGKILKQNTNKQMDPATLQEEIELIPMACDHSIVPAYPWCEIREN